MTRRSWLTALFLPFRQSLEKEIEYSCRIGTGGDSAGERQPELESRFGTLLSCDSLIHCPATPWLQPITRRRSPSSTPDYAQEPTNDKVVKENYIIIRLL
jgi:hypothetical protein